VIRGTAPLHIPLGRRAVAAMTAITGCVVLVAARLAPQVAAADICALPATTVVGDGRSRTAKMRPRRPPEVGEAAKPSGRE